MAKKPIKKGKLTPKMERFCHEYLKDLNATAAARRTGYKEHSARSIGAENLTKHAIQVRIMQLRNTLSTEFNITKESLLAELMAIKNARLEDITDPETGSILPPSQWPEHMKGVISSLEADEIYLGRGEDRTPIGVTKKVKLWEKTKAIELLARMLGYNAPDKVAAVTPDGQAAGTVIHVHTTPAKIDD
jgi:phage terminase small subunit